MKEGIQQTRNTRRDAIVEAARSISAVATQIELAMREAQAPVDRLGDTVARIGLTLAALGAVPATATNDSGLDLSVDMQLDWALGQLQRDFGRTVEDLQFHDRMVQHFSHLCDYLGGIASQLAKLAEQNPGAALEFSPQLDMAAWDGLRQRLFHRLISDPQRQLLEMFLPAEFGGQQMTSEASRRHYAAQGTVELF
jgi:hypothetical protein